MVASTIYICSSVCSERFIDIVWQWALPIVGESERKKGMKSYFISSSISKTITGKMIQHQT